MNSIVLAVAMTLGALPQTPSQTQAGKAESALTLGKPVQIGTIAVVPIECRKPLGYEKYITLAEASRRGLVEIVERPGHETVNSLEVRNKAKLPLLLFAGELLLGGKQDRIVGKDTIVPPGEAREVPVFCVEQGRWSGSTPLFKGGDTFVPDGVRQVTYDKADQSLVWSEVAKANKQVGASPSTGTIQGAMNDPKVKAAVDELAAKLQKALGNSPDTVGVMCWLDGKIQSADIFANGELFAASREELLRSYAVDVQLLKERKPTPVDMKACRAFLNDIVAAKREISEQGRHGSIYKIKDGKLIGYECGPENFGGGFGGGGFGHGSYQPGGGGR